jgi:hypothetical protein
MVALAAFWIAVQATVAPGVADSGLYHFSSIRWLNEYPVVLGLGNLHGRLAFNQSFFAYVAYLNFYPLFNHGYIFANSFLLLLLFSECLLGLCNFMMRKIRPAAEEVCAIAVIPVLVYLGLATNISSPAPDTVSSILQIMIFIQFLRGMDESLSSRVNDSRLIFIFIISAVAITVKLSNVVYVLCICLLLFILKLRGMGLPVRQAFLKIIRWIVPPVFIMLVWSGRGILLSGCPAYPSTSGCLKVEWAVPLESVQKEANWVYSWARQPGQQYEVVLSSNQWLSPWFNRVVLGNAFTLIFPCLTFLLLLGVSLFIFLRKKGNATMFLLPAPVCAGLVFWFLMAPDIRFAHSLFWLLPVSAIVLLLNVICPLGSVRPGKRMVVGLCLLVNANILLLFIIAPQVFNHISSVGYQPVPEVRLIQRQTTSGTKIFIPAKDNQCWNSEIPCTPYFNENLYFVNRHLFPEFKSGM